MHYNQALRALHGEHLELCENGRYTRRDTLRILYCKVSFVSQRLLALVPLPGENRREKKEKKKESPQDGTSASNVLSRLNYRGVQNTYAYCYRPRQDIRPTAPPTHPERPAG